MIGMVVTVAIDSWAGRTYHQARIEKVCPKRVKVYWLACSHRHRTSSYVPKHAVVSVARWANSKKEERRK